MPINWNEFIIQLVGFISIVKCDELF